MYLNYYSLHYTMVSTKYILAASLLSSSAFGLSLLPAIEKYSLRLSSYFELDFKPESNGPEIIYMFPDNPEQKPIPGDSPLFQCEATSPQLLTLELVSIDPNPPVKGQNLTFVAKGVLAKEVGEGAYVDVDVRYGFIRLIHQRFVICEEITKVDLECPIEKGKQVIKKEVAIPEEVPPGKYTVIAKAFTADDEFITCLGAVIEFPPN